MIEPLTGLKTGVELTVNVLKFGSLSFVLTLPETGIFFNVLLMSFAATGLSFVDPMLNVKSVVSHKVGVPLSQTRTHTWSVPTEPGVGV